MKYISRDQQASDYYKRRGYKVYRTGWPDLLITKDGKIRWIEIKGNQDSVKPNQKLLHAILKKYHNIEVEIIRFDVRCKDPNCIDAEIHTHDWT